MTDYAGVKQKRESKEHHRKQGMIERSTPRKLPGIRDDAAVEQRRERKELIREQDKERKDQIRKTVKDQR